ncbi:MAG: hypothetical protein FD126_2541, partial [Elusimicrobia bacterium]
MPEAAKRANMSLSSMMPPRLGWFEDVTKASFLSSSTLVQKAVSARFG